MLDLERATASVLTLADALANAIKAIEPLKPNRDSSMASVPSPKQIRAAIDADLENDADTALWNEAMEDETGLLDAESDGE
jgi:hypothetical protein